jgi:endo-1,4-beta-xylanase
MLRVFARNFSLGLTLLLSLSACSTQTSNTDVSAGDTPGIETEAVARALPAGGTDLLGADTFAAFALYSSGAVKMEAVAVTGKPFTQARRITSSGSFEKSYSEQISAATTAPISTGDVLLIQFWARSVGGRPAQTEFVFESNDRYDKSATVSVALTPQWTLYSVPFRAELDYAAGNGGARFRLGYPDQSFELGGVVLKNYGKTQTLGALPFSGFTYAGRGANAPWRAAADARIEQLRKGDVTVRVQSASGQPIAGAAIKLAMQRHAFPFGSEVAVERLFEDSPDGKKYQAIIPTLFNRVVLGNALKWPVWEGTWKGSERADALRALDFFASKGIPVRGHNLLWPCEQDYCLPADAVALFGNPAGLKARIDQHFVDILVATKGKIIEWDVINEPSENKRLSKVLGEDEMAAQLRRAGDLAPGVPLFINDYGNLGEGNLDAEFKRILRRMQALGAPLGGIGLQAHFGSKLTPPEELNTRLNGFGELGLPLAITEFDVNIPGEGLQADYLRDFLTVAFANKNISSVLMWGFWEGQHWLPQAALYRQDWSIKPNGQAFKNLVFKQWWTNVSGSSDAAGRYQARGFYGDYKLSVTVGGKTTTQTFKLAPGVGEVLVKLP